MRFPAQPEPAAAPPDPEELAEVRGRHRPARQPRQAGHAHKTRFHQSAAEGHQQGRFSGGRRPFLSSL